MRVKRYVVDSMPDALQQIRTDLGKDAVILNTKEIRSGGFLGLFSKKRIEVIAATDSEAKQSSAARPKVAGSSKGGGQAGKAAATAVLEQPKLSQEEKAASLLESIGILSAQNSSSMKPSVPVAAGPRPVVSQGHGAAVYNLHATAPSSPAALTESAPELPATKPSAAPVRQASADPKLPSGASDQEVLHELRAMKQMMQKLAAGGAAGVEPNPAIQELEEQLLQQEVQPEIVAQVLSFIEAQAAEADNDMDANVVRSLAEEQLRQMLGDNLRKALQPDTRIAHFVGPTGVGKTTTIAKLAAEQVLKHRRKVGFITSDTYRIAAVDQLKTYATILGVPLEVVFSPLDLKRAFENLQDRDIIFMDTAGRNFRNEMYVSELNALLQSGVKSETYLVLSLTMKYKDMKAVAANFSKFNLDKVLFTKMDETDTYGSVVNLLHEFPLELSYITTGQNVPDDFRIASENEIIAQILEGQSDE